MQVEDDELSIITSISFSMDVDVVVLSSTFSFVTKSLNISEVEEPTSELASTPLSPEVEPTSILSWRSFDATLDDDDGDCESFSIEIVDNGDDDVVELKTFVINIFGVKRPPFSQLWFDESGLGQMGKGDIIGDEPRLKLNNNVNQIQL